MPRSRVEASSYRIRCAVWGGVVALFNVLPNHALPTHEVFGGEPVVEVGSLSSGNPDAGTHDASSLKGFDLEGRLHQFHQHPETKAVVCVFLSVDCPISNGSLPTLNRFASKYRRSGIDVYGVISDPLITRARAIEHKAEYRLRFPVLFDASGALQRRLSATHTPHAFVLDARQSVTYNGAIDNTYVKLGSRRRAATEHYVQEAIRAAIRGRAPAVAFSPPIGCRIEVPADDAPSLDVTYSRDIAPIVSAHCVQCHRPDQAAPFPLLTYKDVSRHALQIVEVTRSRFMPPWKPAPGFGHFRNEQRLTTQEIALLDEWATDGKAEGDPVDLPAPRTFPPGWRLGTPDLILDMTDEFRVPADGPDIHQYYVLPSRLRDNRLVNAIEFQPGTPSVTHHAAFFLDTNGQARRRDAADPESGYRGFGGPGFPHNGTLRSWLPGMSPRVLPRGTGRLIRRGSDIIVEVHYHSSGKVEQDHFKLGLHFAPRAAKQLVVELQVLNKRLRIPAGDRNHRHRAEYVLPVKTTLLDVVPHMHLLGKEMKVTAILPDGRIEKLIWIKEWDFNWQSQYTYVDPVVLPKGSRIVVDAWYDNSAENPLNPHSPPIDVYWGPESNDEMDICHFQCICDSVEELTTLVADHERFSFEQMKLQRQR